MPCCLQFLTELHPLHVVCAAVDRCHRVAWTYPAGPEGLLLQYHCKI